MHKGTRVIATAALALMVPAIAAASTARLSGLNVPGDYVKGDYTGMYTYLSEVNSVGNLAYVEGGSIERELTDHAVGAVLPGLFDGKYGVWSFHLRQTHPALGQSSNFAPISTGHDSRDPNYGGEAFDIIWGHKMGNGNLALRLNRSFESYDDGTVTEEGNNNGNGGRNILGFGGGYGWDMNASTQVEVGVLYQQRTFDEGPSGYADNGGTNLLVAARAFRKASGNLTIIPAVKYWSQDYSYTDNETTTNYDQKLSGWQAGMAGNWTVGSDDLLVFGANFAQNKLDFGDGDENTQTFMPNVFMALETHLNPWLGVPRGCPERDVLLVLREVHGRRVQVEGSLLHVQSGHDRQARQPRARRDARPGVPAEPVRAAHGRPERVLLQRLLLQGARGGRLERLRVPDRVGHVHLVVPASWSRTAWRRRPSGRRRSFCGALPR
ncbi:MAG: hypothetical protein IPJ04_05015 [Candidatus Eisenbacteria bacterium]|nr:hypothetical protein [Candidatus Eisenbacteria bacterium]